MSNAIKVPFIEALYLKIDLNQWLENHQMYCHYCRLKWYFVPTILFLISTEQHYHWLSDLFVYKIQLYNSVVCSAAGHIIMLQLYCNIMIKGKRI